MSEPSGSKSQLKDPCNIKEQKFDYFLEAKDELADFDVDQTIIIREKYLNFVVGSKAIEEPAQPTYSEEWYPYVNSYYVFTEDTDAVERVNHLLGSKPSFVSTTESSRTALLEVTEEFPYSKNRAQARFLASTPMSFIILGKPDIGQKELGKRLADYWKCVYIEPQTLIEEEMKSNSRAGQCIEYNLRAGRAIGIDILLRLVEKRVKSESAIHRGFVICGLPLVPNALYQEDLVSSESAIFNINEIFEDLLNATVEIGVSQSKPQVSLSSKYQSDVEELKGEGDDDENPEKMQSEGDAEEAEAEESAPGEGADTHRSRSPKSPAQPPPKQFEVPIDVGKDYDVCYFPDIGTNYEDQLTFLFSLFKSQFMIIYVMCSTADVIKKRNNYRYSVYNHSLVDLQMETYKTKLLEQIAIDRDIPEDFLDVDLSPLDTMDMKHAVLTPSNFPANVAVQLDHYHYTAINFIEQQVLLHDPQYFLKLDGRVPIEATFNILKNRIKALPIQPVVLPVHFKITTDAATMGEDVSPKTEELTLPEAMKLYSTRDIVNVNYKWTMSNWGTLCPVSLKEGFYREGSPEFAVHFMNRMFFLANEEAFCEFYRNPRPYLLPPQPRSPCKIFVYGPKCSGKTAISECIGYYFNGTVLSPRQIQEEMTVQKEDEFKEKIRQAALITAMGILNKQREEEAKLLEQERIQKIKEWMELIAKQLEELLILFEEAEKEQTVTKFEISSFPMAMKKVSLAGIETEITIGIRKIRDQLECYKIKSADKEMVKTMLANKKSLLFYVPETLRKRNVPKPATVFDEFVVQYAKQAVEEADFAQLSISPKNIVDMFVTSMKEAEDRYVEKGNHRGGWIMDDMVTDIEILNDLKLQCFAEEVIILRDFSEDNAFLKNRFATRTFTDFVDFHNFFLDIGYVEAAWRAPASVTSTQTHKQKMVRDILSEIVDSDAIYPPDIPSTRVDKYSNEITQFNESLPDLQEYFASLGILVRVVDVANKTVPQLMQEILHDIQEHCRIKAKPFTEEDRINEVRGLGVPEGAGEEAVGEELPKASIQPVDISQVRKYGDMYCYCPVTFRTKWVLWKGKEEFATIFQDKVYLLSTVDNMNLFLTSPRDYVIGKMPESFPPPRICIIGMPGTGKSQVALDLARNFGVSFNSFEDMLRKQFHALKPEPLGQLTIEANLHPDFLNYLTTGEPLPEECYSDSLSKLWYVNPHKELGFVLDDFPKRPSDVDMMTKHVLIPDIVIQLVPKDTEIKTSLQAKYFQEYTNIQQRKRALYLKENRDLLNNLNEMRQIRYQQLLEEKRDQRYQLKRQERIEQDDTTDDEVVSQISFDSVQDQKDQDEINRIIQDEYPDVSLDQDQAENVEDIQKKYETIAGEVIAMETKYLEDLRVKCEQEVIPFVKVPVDMDFPERTFRHVLYITDKIKNRNRSFFETTKEVSVELAENLLNSGYYFLSKFGRFCPVQYQAKWNYFRSYFLMEKMGIVFPVIHRTYIYFVVGKSNLEKFKDDPLLYVDVPVVELPLIRYKVSVTGPPKCGKTTLARRIKHQYGMEVVTRGDAARYVLDLLPLSKLAESMEDVLRKGWELTDEMVAKCVEAACFSSNVLTQSVVFDGFPNNITEVKHLSYIGLVPQLVLDLETSDEDVFDFFEQDPGKPGFPKFSTHFLEHLLEEWHRNAVEFRNWFDKEYQVTATIPTNISNWSTWFQAQELINAVLFEIKHYYINIVKDWPLRLANMQVTPLEFAERQSLFKTFCPCCLHYNNVLTYGGDPPDRTGLVQFRSKFYWLCNEHIEDFLKSPETYIPPYGKNTLPADLPKEVNLKHVPDNVAHDGNCVVCYKKLQSFVPGKLSFAAAFNEKTYLFSSRECLTEFMKTPKLYMVEIRFRPDQNYPALDYYSLPTLGMLEQYVATPIIKALSFITRRRPIIPGLSISTSALIGIGLYLKIYHAKIDPDYKTYYINANNLYHDRRKHLRMYLANMRSVVNPFLYYEEPMPEYKYLESAVPSESTESTVTIVSKIIDEVIDRVHSII